MAQKCEYAKINNFGKLICTVGENQLCSFQRYCSRASEWQNSKAFSTCERRFNVGNKKKSVDLIDTKEEIKEKAIEEHFENVEKKEIKEEVIESINESLIEEIVIPNENIVSESIKEELKPVSEPPKANRKAKEIKKMGKVIGLGKISIIVVDENGNSMRLYNRPQAKIGDLVEL